MSLAHVSSYAPPVQISIYTDSSSIQKKPFINPHQSKCKNRHNIEHYTLYYIHVTYTHTYIHTYIHTYDVCVYTITLTHTYIYIYIYIYIYTQYLTEVSTPLTFVLQYFIISFNVTTLNKWQFATV